MDALERFAHIPGMFNIPTDRELLREKVLKSAASFADELEDKSEAKYIFVAEDLKSGRIIGTSMVAAQHGTEESPHFYFEVGSEKKFSDSINTGFIHGTLKLKYETDGPSEIGGLVIDPEFRDSPDRLGRQMSFTRFLFMALYRARFKEMILAELLPPLNKRGQSPLWEAIGRRFTSMDYWEADQLCSKNKEFIFSLFPTGKIYTTFLSGEARNAIGKVGKDTEPVLHMLQKIGFAYKNQVDPFDGGPHLWAEIDSIVPIKKTVKTEVKGILSGKPGPNDAGATRGLIANLGAKPKEFKALDVYARVDDGKLTVWVEEAKVLTDLLALKTGDRAAFMPYY